MNFVANTLNELKELNLIEKEIYTIQYINRSKLDASENIQVSKAKLISKNSHFIFKVSNNEGIDIFLKEVKIIIENNK